MTTPIMSSFRRKRRPFSTDITTQLLIVLLSVLVVVMVVANVLFLWPALTNTSSNVMARAPDSPHLYLNHNRPDPAQLKNSKQKKQQLQYSTENRTIAEIFRRAGVELTLDEINDLPTWDDIRALVGDHPVIYGLETCQAFRDSIPAVERNLGSAGMFNTGTNLVTQLLKQNCKIPERVQHYGKEASREAHGIRWQVSWGKHTPAHFKWHHATDHAKDIAKETILPVVTIRNPFDWMASMCRNRYTAKWKHSSNQCPHLREDHDESSVPVTVTYAEQRTSSHASLAHLWNDWNQEYLQAEYPRVIVRFEDLIFFPQETLTKICECAGGKVQWPFSYIVKPAKTGPGHGKTSERTDMISAWRQYGKPPEPNGGFTSSDYAAAVDFLNGTIMKLFGYTHPPRAN